MKKLFVYLLCALTVLAGFVPTGVFAASQEQKTVRVGWYESAFHRTDEFGRKSGYGYEYQKRIATYTGWKYEYVEGSWSELFEKLVAGEIDLLSDVSYTEERAEQILYSSEEMGSEDYHVFISPDNTQISPDDFSTFNGKKVGVNKNSIQEQLFVEWAEDQNVHPEIVELTEKTPELLEMLKRGEIDALVTLDTYGTSADVVPVCKVGFANSYFGINKERADLKQELDAAMNRILENNRNFNQQLTEKFNEASSLSRFLNSDEKEWLREHGPIRIGYQENFLPFCGTDEKTKNVTGMLSDYLEFARTCEKNAVIDFETRGFQSTTEAFDAMKRGEIDCVFPVDLTAYDAEQLGAIVTDPILTTELYAIVRTADRQELSADQSLTVAVKKGNTNYEVFLMDHFPNWNPVYYDDLESGFNAVVSGEADCALVSNYRLNRVNRLCTEYNLAPLATGAAMDMAFAVPQEESNLYSILEKINRLIPETMINSSLSGYSYSDEKVTFGDFLRDNLAYVIAIVAVIVAVILLLLLLNVRAGLKASKGQQLISETERDRLTNLYNRGFFFVYANRMKRDNPEKQMDAIVLNIERFHAVNRLNGREFGDEVLKALGTEIGEFLKETEGIAGRLEGDHFDIYCAHRDDYQAVFDRFQACLDAVSRNADIRLRMGVMPWQEDIQPEAMFDLARAACSKVRGNYKNPLMVYNEELRKREQFDQRLLNDFSRALDERQFEVYYQPKFSIRTDPVRLSSAEALIRWKHPDLGLIPPTDFITLFERSGQISQLDRYVWTEAAAQVAAWRDRYGFVVPVSVNLSRVDVFDPDLCTILDGIVRDNKLSRKDLKLEVTETAYTDNADQLIRVIGSLRERGYEIEMDDFGSGYSSLNMLSSMPIDILKMDMAFIRNIEREEKDFRLVELILDIGRYLKVPVIAEGVENEYQLQLLKDAGCDIVQGFYFSKPLPADEFEKIIQDEKKFRQ